MPNIFIKRLAVYLAKQYEHFFYKNKKQRLPPSRNLSLSGAAGCHTVNGLDPLVLRPWLSPGLPNICFINVQLSNIKIALF